MHRGIALGGVVLLGVVLGGVAVADEDWRDLVDEEGDAPFVDAGLDQEVVLGDEVFLDGGGTWDDQNDITDYEWTIETPDGRTIEPQCPNCVFTRFRVNQTGQYNVTLTVRDAEDHERSDTLYVTVEALEGGGGVGPISDGGLAANGSGGLDEPGCWVAHSTGNGTIRDEICDDHSTAVDFEYNDAGGIQYVVFEGAEVSNFYSDREYNYDDGSVIVSVQTFKEEARDAWNQYKESENANERNTASTDNTVNDDGDDDILGDDYDPCTDYPGAGCPY